MKGPTRARAAVLLAASLAFLGCRHESNLPKLFPLPEAHLTSDTNQPVKMSDMHGYVTVYDFIFTNCAASCPMMTRTMQLATKKIDRDRNVRFVSISVDPARDTVSVLHDYATKARGDDARWMFLTGDRDTLINLSVNGFKLAASANVPSGTEPLLHSEKFAIADKTGTIREYVSSSEDDAPEHVARTVHDLLREE